MRHQLIEHLFRHFPLNPMPLPNLIRHRSEAFRWWDGLYLKDFYNLLTPFGYVIGKLYSNYIDFRPHEAEMEHFLGPNYFALRKNLPSVQDTLKKGW
jgi:hypothetical protein